MSAFCSEPGCVGIANTGKFCPAHVADNYLKRQNATRPDIDSWYSRAAWRGPHGVRRFKLHRFPICETPGCGKPSTEVHHTRDWKLTRDWFVFMGGIDMEFLQALCHECHSRVTLEENRKCKRQS